MSDTMLLGVLRMPPELWTDSPIDVRQRHARYMQAAAHIECAAIEIEHLQTELAEARRERDLLREFMADICAALKCEQNDEVALLAIDELRDEVDLKRACIEGMRESSRRLAAERDRLREGLIRIRDSTFRSAVTLRGVADNVIDAAMRGEP